MQKLDTNKLKNLPINLKNLKSKVDKLDADKLVSVPVDLSKLSSAVKNDVVTKDFFEEKYLTLLSQQLKLLSMLK